MPGTRWLGLDAWKALVATGRAPADAALLKSYVAEIKADGDARTVDFTISTGSVDRERDTIAVDGWKLAAFKKNPVVQWAHDYSMPPIARATKIRVDGDALKATAEFAPAEVYPFAETIFQLIKGGFLKATSVGFRPMKHAFNAERGGMDFLNQELLEFSIVPVPANSECLMEGKAAGIDIAPVRAWAEAVMKGLGHVWAPGADLDEKIVPGNPSGAKAPEDEAWAAPSLSDFTTGAWDDLTDPEKRKIAKHFAWANQMPPDSFGDLKLPHHRASDGAVVLRGVIAAAGRLNQTSGIDEQAVKAHLAAHYRQFDKTPPWESASAEGGISKDADDLLRQALADLEFKIDALAESLKHEPEPELGDAVLALSDEAPGDEADGIELDAEDVRAACAGALQEMVTAEVRGALNALRGRVD